MIATYNKLLHTLCITRWNFFVLLFSFFKDKPCDIFCVCVRLKVMPCPTEQWRHTVWPALIPEMLYCREEGTHSLFFVFFSCSMKVHTQQQQRTLPLHLKLTWVYFCSRPPSSLPCSSWVTERKNRPVPETGWIKKKSEIAQHPRYHEKERKGGKEHLTCSFALFLMWDKEKKVNTHYRNSRRKRTCVPEKKRKKCGTAEADRASYQLAPHTAKVNLAKILVQEQEAKA